MAAGNVVGPHIIGASWFSGLSGGVPVVSTLADVNTLMANLGGNSTFSAFYDDRVNVTATSGNVSAWADCRTVGQGPTISYFGSGTNPTWAGSGNPVVTVASGASMLTATSSTFNSAGPSSLVFVLSCSDTSGNPFCAVKGTAFMGLYGGTTDYFGVFGNGELGQDSGVALGSTVRVAVVTVASGGASGTVQVWNHAVQTKSSLTSTTANAALALGSYTGVSGTAIAASFHAVAYAPSVLSAAQVTTFGNWAVTNHGAVSSS